MISKIPLRELLHDYGPRDIATVERIIEDEHDAKRPPKQPGEVTFHWGEGS